MDSKVLIYKASAGSGKTFQLAYNYIKLLYARPNDRNYKRIVAVTFTNKATNEMKRRIVQQLADLSNGEGALFRNLLKADFPHFDDAAITHYAKAFLRDILNDYTAFRVTTIDSFFQQIIRAFSREFDLLDDFQIELDNDTVLQDTIDHVMSSLDTNPELLRWLQDFSESKMEEGKKWQFNKDVFDLSKQIFNEQFKQISDELLDALKNKETLKTYIHTLLQIRFGYEKEAKEICDRAQSLMNEFHLTVKSFSNGNSGLANRFFYDKLTADNFEMKSRFFEGYNDVTKWYSKSSKEIDAIESAYHRGLGDCANRLFDLINDESSRKQAYLSAKNILNNIYVLGIFGDILKQLRADMLEQKMFLISNTNEFINRIIDGSDVPFIYEKTGINIDHFLIDEFQDTSQMQWDNFKPLLKNSVDSGYENVLVGDVKQSIYRWRNSDWSILHNQAEIFFKGQTKHIRLKTNWRSYTNVIQFNNDVFSRIIQNHPEFPIIQDIYDDVEQEPTKKNGGYVEVRVLEKKGETTWKDRALDDMFSAIQELISSGFSYDQMAVLVRKNDDGEKVVNYLLDKNLPVMSSDALMINNALSVKLLLAVLKYFTQPDDALCRANVYFLYKKLVLNGESDALLEELIKQDGLSAEEWENHLFGEKADTFRQLKQYPLFKITESLITLFELNKIPEEIPYFQAFQDIILDYSATKNIDINLFLQTWDMNGDKKALAMPENQNCISVMTIHKAKGLEYDAVFIPFLEFKYAPGDDVFWLKPDQAPFNEIPYLPVKGNNSLPKTIFSKDFELQQIQSRIEALNLAYVAMTRAVKVLYVFMPQKAKNPTTSYFSYDLIDVLNEQFSDEDGTLVYRVGQMEQQPKKKAVQESFPLEYVTNDVQVVDKRLKLSYVNSSMWKLSEDRRNTVRDYGNLMHNALGRILTIDDVDNAIAEMLAEELIDEQEAVLVKTNVNKVLRDLQDTQWFSGEYRVLKESEIITGEGFTYRPDRVMIKTNEAIVLDYKFGESKEEKYNKQVKNYMNLIQKMGYQVRGYLFYAGLEMPELIEIR